jgi:hypothetical protein
MLQSVLFDRSLWSEVSAEEWLQSHGYAAPPVDATAHYYRYRQVDPMRGAYYATRALGLPGVKGVIMASPSVHAASSREGGGALPEAPEGQVPARIPGDRLTSDQELDAWGRANIPGFLGVVSRTDFGRLYPEGKPMAPGTSCVLNLDPGYSHGGSHWVGVRVAESQPLVLYSDSFGLPPPREVTLRGRRDGRGILYPDVQYQDMDEVNCGPRALAALKLLSDGAKKGEELEALGRLGAVRD